FMERKQAEDAVRASEARKSALLEALDSIVSIDAEGIVTEFNAAAERTFGYGRADAVGHEMAELIVPVALRERHRRALRQCVRTGVGTILGRRIEMTAMRSDGSELPVELTVTRVPGSEPAIFTGAIRDITERKRAEAERAALLTRERESRRQAEAANRAKD